LTEGGEFGSATRSALQCGGDDRDRFAQVCIAVSVTVRMTPVTRQRNQPSAYPFPARTRSGDQTLSSADFRQDLRELSECATPWPCRRPSTRKDPADSCRLPSVRRNFPKAEFERMPPCPRSAFRIASDRARGRARRRVGPTLADALRDGIVERSDAPAADLILCTTLWWTTLWQTIHARLPGVGTSTMPSRSASARSWPNSAACAASGSIQSDPEAERGHGASFRNSGLGEVRRTLR